MSNPNPERDERVREQFHECPMCCYDCDCTQGNAGGLCLHCNDPLIPDEAEDVATIAATRMRDRCVEHLQATADALDVRQETECPSGTAFNSEAALRRRIATELQSLTLDEGEQKQ